MYNKDRFKIYIQVQIKIYLYCLLAGSVSIHFFIYNWILICRKQNYYQKSQFEVWEICKFWILQNHRIFRTPDTMVWEIYKFWILQNASLNLAILNLVWEICKFWILQNASEFPNMYPIVWEICKFWILQNKFSRNNTCKWFERYVNFEFYKTIVSS